MKSRVEWASKAGAGSRWMIGWAAGALVLGLVSGGAPVRADLIYVGPGCEETGLQVAIDEALSRSGPDELRLIAGLTFTESVLITDPDVTISGGWVACGSSNVVGRTSVAAASTDAIVAFGAGVILERLDVRAPGGTALDSQGSFVVLTDTRLWQSSVGLRARGPSAAIVDPDSRVAQNGRGIYCSREGSSAGPQIEIAGTVEGATTSSGIWALDGCEVDVVDGASVSNNAGGGIFLGVVEGPGATLDVVGGPQGITINDNGSPGIQVTASDSVASVSGPTEIAYNTATSGAGISVTVGQLFLDDGVHIHHNTATSYGGGLALTFAGARADLSAGVRISDNVAQLGGGIGVSGGELRAIADGAPIEIHDNRAEYGGGVNIFGQGSALLLNNWVYENVADVDGGGAYVTEEGFFQMERGNFIVCESPPFCSLLSFNRIGGAGRGTALLADAGGTALLMQSFLRFNDGMPGLRSSAIAARGADSSVEIEGLELYANDVEYLVEAESGGEVIGRFLTAAGNLWSLGLDGGQVPAFSARENGGEVALYSSIFVDTSGATGGSVTVDCMIVDDDTNLQYGPGTVLVGVDPGFVDREAGNHFLRSGSPAVDFCDDFFVVPLDRDLELDLRGQQVPAQPDRLGPYDIGFDENPSLDLLFLDGFESGATDRWSGSAG